MVAEIRLATGFRLHLWDRHSAATTARAQRLNRASLLLGRKRLGEQQRQQAVRDAFKLAGSLSTFGAVEGSQRAMAIGTAFLAPSLANPAQAAHLHSGCMELLHSVQQLAEKRSHIVYGLGRPALAQANILPARGLQLQPAITARIFCGSESGSVMDFEK